VIGTLERSSFFLDLPLDFRDANRVIARRVGFERAVESLGPALRLEVAVVLRA